MYSEQLHFHFQFHPVFGDVKKASVRTVQSGHASFSNVTCSKIISFRIRIIVTALTKHGNMFLEKQTELCLLLFLLSSNRVEPTVVSDDSVFGRRRLRPPGQSVGVDLHSTRGKSQDHHGESRGQLETDRK